MNNLAITYQNQGRWDKAEKLEVQVIEIRKAVLGAEHPSTLTSMNNLAYTWKSQGKLQDALALMKKCSELCSTVLGPNHPDAKSSSRALRRWMDKYSSVADHTPLTQIECPEHLQEISITPPTARAITLSARDEHINLPYIQRRSPASLFLGTHPLIIASRTPLPALGGQDLEEVD
jgi:hypothetical protein